MQCRELQYVSKSFKNGSSMILDIFSRESWQLLGLDLTVWLMSQIRIAYFCYQLLLVGSSKTLIISTRLLATAIQYWEKN